GERQAEAEDTDAVLLITRDVTERNRAISRVAASENHVRKIMDTVVEGIVTADQNGVIETINPAAERIFGYAAGELTGQNIDVLMSEADAAVHLAHIDRFIETGVGHFMGKPRELTGIRKDGTPVSIELTVSAMQNAGRHTFIAALHDITERKMVEARLVELATLDRLTKLPNRTAYKQRLEQAIARVSGTAEMFAVLFVNLDNFRNINETRGHIVADEVIKTAGERLRNCLRTCDTVAHFGGDEFMVLLDHVSDDEETISAGQIILEALAQPFVVSGLEVFVTASVGIALYPQHGERVGELLKNADTALHDVKQRQRGTLAFYSPQLTDTIDKRVRLEAGLRQALANNEIYLNFQPKVDLDTRRVVGAERAGHALDHLRPWCAGIRRNWVSSPPSTSCWWPRTSA
ncbi:MAG: diguanylate cyclase, partial [Rhodospirillaceae bacterium]